MAVCPLRDSAGYVSATKHSDAYVLRGVGLGVAIETQATSLEVLVDNPEQEAAVGRPGAPGLRGGHDLDGEDGVPSYTAVENAAADRGRVRVRAL